ncbi:MAG: CDP-alcohol phosphatidyltransferase family protein [Acidimicrobiales bacterium]
MSRDGGTGPGRADAPCAGTIRCTPLDSAIPDDASEGEGDLGRVLTVPNAISAVRLACVPLFLWLLFGAGEQSAAAVLLGLLGATDWVDGTVARRYQQVSNLGKVLDPVADRVLVATSVIAIVVRGAVPVWFGAATLAREAVVSIAVLLLASMGASRIDVLWVGKAGTFGLLFAYPAFLLGHGSADWQEPVRIFAWVAGLAGLTLAWVAAASYLPAARRAWIDGRSGHRGRPRSREQSR